MQAETFSDPAVQKELAAHYVALKVDHDANPLLANRYRDYGWPALIFLAAGGTEIVKRAGYIAPAEFLQLLKAIERDPSPEQLQQIAVPATAMPTLSAAARATLLKQHDDSYDSRLGGLRTTQKFIDRDSVEYALLHADNPAERRKAEQTLTAATALIDPVWGGVYQYSTGSDWLHPHYEKIMRTQAGVLRIHALGWARLGRPADLRAAQAVRDYLLKFLRTPAGAFRVSQDADLVQGRKAHDYFALNDAGRRALGMPRIDPNLYADANGQAAEALATLHEFAGDSVALDASRKAAGWLLTHRLNKDGSFRHGDRAGENRYLNDSLASARAFLQLYRATGERRWLERATATADAIRKLFPAPSAGFLTATADHSPIAPLPDLSENISAARFFNLLHHYSGRGEYRDAAQRAMRFLAADSIIDSSIEEAGILLADEELGRAPLHLVIVGARSDPVAGAMFAAALRAPASYKRLEWWDRSEGALPNADVEYPKFSRAAAYVCTAGRCSTPSLDATVYAAAIQRLSMPTTTPR